MNGKRLTGIVKPCGRIATGFRELAGVDVAADLPEVREPSVRFTPDQRALAFDVQFLMSAPRTHEQANVGVAQGPELYAGGVVSAGSGGWIRNGPHAVPATQAACGARLGDRGDYGNATSSD